MTRLWIGCLAVLAVLAAAGCGAGLASPSQFVTESFTGTLEVSGVNLHGFNVTRNGELNVTVRTVTPNTVFAIALGQVSGGQCQDSGAGGSLVSLGSVVTGMMVPGSYCIAVYDPGSLTASITYTIDVTHP